MLQYVFTASASLGASGGAGLYWDFTTDAGTVRRSEPFDGPCSGWKSGSVLAADEDDDNNVDSGSVLVEVGVYAHAGTTTELWLGELKITTLEVDDLPRSKLSSVVASAEGGDVRLAWNVYASLSEWAPGRSMGLWSEQTKDFAYFVVWKGEEVRGVAYACVFVATAAEEEGEGRTVGWRVDGVTWDGEVVKGSDGVH